METAGEIILEIREKLTRCGVFFGEDIRKWLDRLEAAWKRDEERAVEHATRHAESVARDNCRDCVHNPEGKNYEGGNAAALREALEAALRFIGNLEIEPYSPLDEDASELRQKIMDAISAPARNCDLYNDVEDSWRDYKKFRSQIGEDIYFDMVHFWPFAMWLFALAAERKGEGK